VGSKWSPIPPPEVVVDVFRKVKVPNAAKEKAFL
jgi:hypothetical protein